MKVVNRKSAARAAAPRRGEAGVQCHRPRGLNGARLSGDAGQVVIPALEVEWRGFGVDAAQDLEPFEPLTVAVLENLKQVRAGGLDKAADPEIIND